MDYYFVKHFRGNIKWYVSGTTAAGSYTWTSDRKKAIRMPLWMAAQVEMACVGYNATPEMVENNAVCANMGSAF